MTVNNDDKEKDYNRWNSSQKLRRNSLATSDPCDLQWQAQMVLLLWL